MLHSVCRLADEIVIGIDTRTTDRTRELAADYWAKTVDVDWRDDFSYARNLTLDAATGDWVFVLDADERLTREGADAIRKLIGFAPVAPGPDSVTGMAFVMSEHSLDGLTVYGQHYTSMRLFRRTPDIRYRGVVHEEPWYLPDVPSTLVGLISGAAAIAHVGYDPAIWVGRQKHARNVRMLEARVAADPTDSYARSKLEQTLATDQPFTTEKVG
jgi:hypothetical protein